jgi:phosphoribosylformylglycinamidine cyclo-ligase
MPQNAYADAGVDIEAGQTLIERLKPALKATQRPGVTGTIGGFSSIFDPAEAGLRDPLYIAATDGVGTKLRLAIEADGHETIGQDLVAMCANDILVAGARPLYFLDYYACGKLDIDSAERVIAGIAQACAQIDCALSGGETAEMPGMYAESDFDLAGFCVGAVERDQLITGDAIQAGDVIIGLASDGVHANGFSLVRKILAYYDICNMPAPFDQDHSLAEMFLTPTRLYVQSVQSVLAACPGAVHGMAHITGGGVPENVPRVLPEGVRADIHLAENGLAPIFSWLQSAGDLSAGDMARTFNCGTGYILLCAPESAEQVVTHLNTIGEKAGIIGEIKPHDGETPYLNLRLAGQTLDD